MARSPVRTHLADNWLEDVDADREQQQPSPVSTLLWRTSSPAQRLHTARLLREQATTVTSLYPRVEISTPRLESTLRFLGLPMCRMVILMVVQAVQGG